MRSAPSASGATTQKTAVSAVELAMLMPLTDRLTSSLAPFQVAPFLSVDRQVERAATAPGAIDQKTAVCAVDVAMLMPSTDQTPSHLAPFQAAPFQAAQFQAAQFQVVDRQVERAATAPGAIDQKTAVCAVDVAMLTPSTPTQSPV
jgi:hypothetical protein